MEIIIVVFVVLGGEGFAMLTFLVGSAISQLANTPIHRLQTIFLMSLAQARCRLDAAGKFRCRCGVWYNGRIFAGEDFGKQPS